MAAHWATRDRFRRTGRSRLMRLAPALAHQTFIERTVARAGKHATHRASLARLHTTVGLVLQELLLSDLGRMYPGSVCNTATQDNRENKSLRIPYKANPTHPQVQTRSKPAHSASQFDLNLLRARHATTCSSPTTAPQRTISTAAIAGSAFPCPDSPAQCPPRSSGSQSQSAISHSRIGYSSAPLGPNLRKPA